MVLTACEMQAGMHFDTQGQPLPGIRGSRQRVSVRPGGRAGSKRAPPSPHRWLNELPLLALATPAVDQLADQVGWQRAPYSESASASKHLSINSGARSPGSSQVSKS